MKIGDGDFVFELDDGWYDGPHHTGKTDGWAHHGIAVTTAGEVVTFDEKLPQVQVLSRSGDLVRTFGVDLIEGHGILVVREDDEDFLWISDNGAKRTRGDDGNYEWGPSPCRGCVAKYRLDGTNVFRLNAPELPVYAAGGDFGPTQVAVDETRFGGTGDIWVADGYGQSLVHRFDEAGTLLATLDGTAGAGRFSHPHAVFIDRRRQGAPELLVADRRNRRIQAFDLGGGFLHSFGDDVLLSPSGFATYGQDLLVTELDGRITVFDEDFELRAYIGVSDPSAQTRPGWPNELRLGKPCRPELRPDAFNSPHGIAVDVDGTIYVTEWLIGGRLDKLVPSRSQGRLMNDGRSSRDNRIPETGASQSSLVAKDSS